MSRNLEGKYAVNELNLFQIYDLKNQWIYDMFTEILYSKQIFTVFKLSQSSMEYNYHPRLMLMRNNF